MKILLLTNMYPSEQAPNYGVFVQRTENILKKAGHNLVLVALTKKFSFAQKLLGYFNYVLKFFANALFAKPDVIYVHYASQNARIVVLLKKMKPSIPIILNTHGTDILPQSKAQEKYQPAVHRLMNEVDHVIVPSTYYQQVVKEKYNYQGPVTIFPSGGVNTEFFHPNTEQGNQFRQENNIPTDKTVISYISRVDAYKGWDTLLESVSLLKENQAAFNKIHVVIAGSGAQDELLLDKIRELNLSDKVTRKPMLTQMEMHEVFNASDVFCFPSFQESLGLVGLEAMATGLPILASDIPGTKDYVNEKNSLVFDAGNADELANTIVKFLHLTTEELQSLREHARETAIKFDSSTVTDKLLNVFIQKTVLESKRGT